MQILLTQKEHEELLEDGRFCGRAERWAGHALPDFHDFVSLAGLLQQVGRYH